MLGITKAAVYYHFSSRDDLVRSIVQPLIDDGEKFVLEHERRRDTPVRALLESYFDFHYRHRRDLMLVLVEMGMLARTLGWSTRCWPGGTTRQAGVRPEADAGAGNARGGRIRRYSGLLPQFPDTPVKRPRAAAVDASLAALGLAENGR